MQKPPITIRSVVVKIFNLLNYFDNLIWKRTRRVKGPGGSKIKSAKDLPSICLHDILKSLSTFYIINFYLYNCPEKNLRKWQI